jgi:type IV secretion system protein VirB4
MKKRDKGFEEHLNYWLPLCDNPTVLGFKGGEFFRAWDMFGPDLRYASEEERARLSAIQGQAFRLVSDNGWVLQSHRLCDEQTGYLPRTEFPDPTSALIDEESRRRYTQQGAHYEHAYALCLTWKPQHEWAERYSPLFYEGMDRGKEGKQGMLKEFIRVSEEMTAILGTVVQLDPMDRDGLYTYLRTCVTGQGYRVRAPQGQVPWSHAMMDQEVWTGEQPKVGPLHVRTVTIEGFPAQSEPQMLEFYAELDFPYHAHHRFIFMDKVTADMTLDAKRKKHANKRVGAKGFFARVATGDSGHKQNIAATVQADDAQMAQAENELGEAAYGIYTGGITLFHEDQEEVERRAGMVQQLLHFRQFQTRLERMNAVEAWLGGCPGQVAENIRQFPIHALNLADFLPVTSIWTGQKTVTSPFFPEGAPVLMMGTTYGKAPFYLSPYYSDLGNTLMVGPPGSGKTTNLNMMAASWLRYPHSRVRAFDAKYGMYALCRAVGGTHHDIGGVDRVGVMPYARVENERERIWAHRFTLECLRLQHCPVSEKQSNEIWDTLTLMGSKAEGRSMTDFVHTLQDQQLRQGMRYYTKQGAGGDLFDQQTAPPLNSRFIVFELMHLFSRGQADLLPAVLYFFHEVERELNGTPTLIPMDEGWKPLLDSTLGEKVEEWERTFRDKNAVLVFATQFLADVARSPIYAHMVGACPTKIFAPDPVAETDIKKYYEGVGLNDKQIAAVRHGLPKSDYLITSPLGTAEYTMNLGRAVLAFVGMSGVENVPKIRAIADKYGPVWPYHHLLAQGCSEEAAWWMADYERRQGKEKPYETCFTVPATAYGNGVHPVLTQ